MKTVFKVLTALIIIIIAFVIHIFVSTGFFRKIEPKFEGVILNKVIAPGTEDMVISRTDSFLIISSTDRGSYPPTREEEGQLLWMDLKNDNFIPISLTKNLEIPFAPHGISMFKQGNVYHIKAINHTDKGHSIEVFELQGKKLTHKQTLTNETLVSPNDLVMVDETRFYFTNDHGNTSTFGKLLEDYLGLALSNIVYFDGVNYKEAAANISYANGINIDTEKNLLYVASPRQFEVQIFDIHTDGTLSNVENIACGTGVDNIDLDEEGNLWIGGHPNLLRFGAYAKGQKDTAPSEIIKVEYSGNGNYSIHNIYVDDGSQMSGSSVAISFGDLIFTGNVKDPHFLVLSQNVKE